MASGIISYFEFSVNINHTLPFILCSFIIISRTKTRYFFILSSVFSENLNVLTEIFLLSCEASGWLHVCFAASPLFDAMAYSLVNILLNAV